MDVSSACLPAPRLQRQLDGSSFLFMMWSPLEAIQTLCSAFPGNWERVCVKYQSNSTQVESVSNNVLIYACACPSWRERAWKRQKREQQSQSWRILTCSCQVRTEWAYVYVWACLYVCLSVRWLRPPPIRPNSPVKFSCRSHSAACLRFQMLAASEWRQKHQLFDADLSRNQDKQWRDQTVKSGQIFNLKQINRRTRNSSSPCG